MEWSDCCDKAHARALQRLSLLLSVLRIIPVWHDVLPGLKLGLLSDHHHPHFYHHCRFLPFTSHVSRKWLRTASSTRRCRSAPGSSMCGPSSAMSWSSTSKRRACRRMLLIGSARCVLPVSWRVSERRGTGMLTLHTEPRLQHARWKAQPRPVRRRHRRDPQRSRADGGRVLQGCSAGLVCRACEYFRVGRMR